MRAEDLSKTLDHLVLAPDTDVAEIEAACDLAVQYHFAALCALPEFVPLIADRLRGTDVKTCATIGYPDGTGGMANLRAAEQAVTDGANELDVVMNVPAMLGGQFTLVRDELVRIVRAVRSRAANNGRGDVIVKVIIEAPLLDDKLVRLACKIVDDAGADFAITSTGYDGRLATTHDVEVMRDALPERVGVQAAGGVAALEDVQAMISAGAARVGTDCAVAVLEELLAADGGPAR
ncbi:MAG: deoxyribose-phosphate aldolase [Thermoleophilia bacterium]|nr:deoxyribose-phosphate aldolase [Thermoleophilia bacterium]